MIKNKLSELAELKAMAYSVTVSNDGERVQTSGDKDKIGAVMSKIVDMENEVDNLVDRRSNIVRMIDEMENETYYDMLTQIYVLKKDLKAIAVEKKHTYRHVQRLRDSAIEEFERLYGKLYFEMS